MFNYVTSETLDEFLLRPSTKEQYTVWGPPPTKEWRLYPGWGSFYSYRPDSSLGDKDWGWGWEWRYVPKNSPKYGWASGWGWYMHPDTETPPAWGKWSHKERPWTPGWGQKGPCCSSGRPYFSPSWGPYGPGYPFWTKK